ncbi:MAG: futalosine hydrolase [Bacteroidetes bacterium]|jgi:futalosine hydrolase|nr:futalosine hydrolase [Bacteroidota bacterium]
MKLLIVSATPFEIAPLINHLGQNFEKKTESVFSKNELEITILITGVGIAYTGYSLGKLLTQNTYDFAINVGIAGAFNRNLKIGEVVQVISERFGDLGVEEADGTFTDMHELGLLPPNDPPFENGLLLDKNSEAFQFLKKVNGLTINKVHGYTNSIEAIQKKYAVDIESMEGAAFFLACKLEEIPFLQIRSISNYVESRNRENWNLPLAIENLNKTVIEMLGVFEN